MIDSFQKHWSARAGALILFLALLFPGAGRADNNHYQNYVIGERASGMGGAFVALSDDPSGAYYNPAGIAHIDRPTMSVSANIYGVVRSVEKDAYGAGKDFIYEDVNTIPTTFGYVIKMDDGSVVAFNILAPDTLSYSDTFSTNSFKGEKDINYIIERSRSETSLWVGGAYSRKFGASASLGVGVFAIHKSVEDFFDAGIDVGSGYFQFAKSSKYKNTSILVQIGALHKVSETFRLGVCLRGPSIDLGGDGYIYDRNASAGVQLFDDKAKTQSGQPMKVTIGAAYSPPGRITIAADASYVAAGSHRIFKDYPATKITKESVFNVNVGGEYYFRDHYPVRVGFFTNHSAAPPYSVKNWEDLDVNEYGITASLGKEDKQTTFNAGIIYVIGSGHTRGFADNLDFIKTNATTQRIYLFIGSSFFL